MTTSGKIGIKGMKPTGNELTLPPGSITDTFGMCLPTNGVIRQQRGMTGGVYVDNDASDANTNRPRELYQWGAHLLVNYTGGPGYRLSSFSNFATSPVYANVGSFAPPDPNTLRMKFAELAKCLLWTTDAGLYLLDSITGAARSAGLTEPLIFIFDPDASVGTRLSGNPSATGSWFPKNHTAAARAVCCKRDTNGRIVESAPSGRAVVVNPADLTVAIGALVRNTNVVTATVSAHKFRVGDTLNLTLTGGDVGNFDTTDNVVTAVTATSIVWAETAANYTNVASVTITSGTKSIQWSVRLTADMAAGDFVRIYRTDEAAGEAVDPGDECFLSYERSLTATDISNGYVLIVDTTPSSFLRAPLITNPNSGEGPILGRNDRPPLAKDVCVWDGRLWGAETTDRHRLTLSLIGTGTPNGLQLNDVLAINARVYRVGTEAAPGSTEFTAYTSYLVTENVDKTTWFASAVIRAQQATTGLTAFQRYDGSTGLGQILLEQLALGSTMADGSSGAISAIYAATSRTTAFGDRLATTKAITAASTARTLGTTVTVRCTAHGFVAAQVIMIAYAHGAGSPDANFAVGLKTVATVVDANNFTYTESGSNATLSGGTPYYAYAVTYKSDDGKKSLRFSKQRQPESWPLPYFVDRLPDGAEVLRIRPTPDGGELMVWLKNGDTYALSGFYPYSARRVTGSAPLIFPDTLREHSDRLYGVTTQGISTLGSVGVGLVGLDVDDDVRAIVAGILAGDATIGVPFAMDYDSERQIHFLMPALTALTGAVGSSNARAYVLHSLRDEYSKLSSAHTCGLVFKGADYIVAGQVASNRLLVERKTMGTDGLDFAGQVYALIVDGNQNNVSTIQVDVGTGSANFFGGEAVNIGGTYYRITAATASSITIDGTVSVVDTDNLTAYAAPFSSLAFAVESAGVPGIEKQFREIQFHFGVRLFRTLTIGFSSELSASESQLVLTADDFAYRTPSSNPTTFRAEVPDAMKQAALLKVTMQVTGALQYFNLLGYSVSYEPVSEKTGRG